MGQMLGQAQDHQVTGAGRKVEMRRAMRLLAVGATFALIGCESPPAPAPGPYERVSTIEWRDAQARAELERLGARVAPQRGGTAVVVRDASPAEADAAIAAAGRLMDLSSLTVIGSQPTQGWPARLRNPAHLRHVVVSGSALSAADIAALGRLPRLESLHLIDAGLTDGAVAYLVEHDPGLRQLTIAHEGVTDDGAIWLARLAELRNLRLVDTAVSGKRITYLLIENPWLIVELGEEGDEVKGGWAPQ